MNQKWFWGTLLFLTLFSGSIVSWALISSPLRFEPQVINHFENDFNGQKQRTDIWVNQGRLTELLPLVTQEMEKNNWKSLGRGIDLGSAILGLNAKGLDFSDQFDVKVWEKDGVYRTIGLLQSKDTDTTYGATSDFPKTAFDMDKTLKNWNFPIPPPRGDDLLFNVQLKNVKLGIVLFSHSEEPFKNFKQLCSEKGFSQNLEEEEKNKKVFLLTDKKNKILAIFDQEGPTDSIALFQID